MIQETSKDSYSEIKSELGERQRSVYNALKVMKEATNTMIAKYLNLPINSVTPRVFELREKKLVGVSYIAYCKITKRRAIFWKIVR